MTCRIRLYRYDPYLWHAGCYYVMKPSGIIGAIQQIAIKFLTKVMSSSNETRPLLQATGDARPGPVGNAKAQTVTVRPSPLDISRSARHGILAGLILGAFVSVSVFPF